MNELKRLNGEHYELLVRRIERQALAAVHHRVSHFTTRACFLVSSTVYVQHVHNWSEGGVIICGTLVVLLDWCKEIEIGD